MLFIYKRKLIYLFVAFLFSMVVVNFPWEDVRNYDFIDLSINLMKFEYPEYYFNTNLNYRDVSFYISEEPLWYYINIIFNNFNIKGEFFFNFLAFLCFFVHSVYILRERVSPFYLLLYLNPLTLDFIFSQQRNALCFCVFLMLYGHKKIGKYFFMAILPLVHSLSFIFIIQSFFIDTISKIRINRFFLNFLVLFLALVISIIIVYGRSILQVYTDDNRFGEYEIGVNSFLYLLPWLLYLFYFILFSIKSNLNYLFLLFFLGIYVFLTFFNFYGIRFLAMSIPFLILNINNLKYKHLFICLFILHQLMLLYFWLKI